MLWWRVRAWESHFQGEEVGMLAQEKRDALPAFVDLGSSLLWLKQLEAQNPLGGTDLL